MRAETRDRITGNPVVRFGYRAYTLARERESVRRRPRASARFLFRGREVDNFTYEVANLTELAGFAAAVAGRPLEAAEAALEELERDSVLYEELEARLRPNRRREPVPRFGYRRAAYAVVRLVRPAAVVEVGTHDGLGAAAMAAALDRNASDGEPGTLHTLDQNPSAGWLIPERLRPRVRLHVGDVLDVLPAVLAQEPAELLFQDVGHAFEPRAEVFAMAADAARGPVTIMSEIDGMPELSALARERGGRYHSFRETPLDHFWHGHEWGAAVLPGPR